MAEMVRDFTGKRVLLVEPNELNAKLFKDLMEAHGAYVDYVADPRRVVAWVACASASYDLIVLSAEGGEELAVLEEVRRGLPTMPIVFVTAFAMKGDEEAYAALDATLVTKPISVERFLQAVAEKLGVVPPRVDAA